jgi:hypothetical protein
MTRLGSMRHPTPHYLLLAFREAMQSLLGTGLAMALTCMAGGAIPLLAAWPDLWTDGEYFVLAFGWVGHWITAGIMLWGFLAVIVPAACLYELLHGTSSPWLVLTAVFETQLLVSTVALCVLGEADHWQSPVIAAIGTGVTVAVSALAVNARERKNQPA